MPTGLTARTTPRSAPELASAARLRRFGCTAPSGRFQSCYLLEIAGSLDSNAAARHLIRANEYAYQDLRETDRAGQSTRPRAHGSFARPLPPGPPGTRPP